MKKIVHVQTIMFEEDLIELKKKTKEVNTKDALTKAIEYYLEVK